MRNDFLLKINFEMNILKLRILITLGIFTLFFGCETEESNNAETWICDNGCYGVGEGGEFVSYDDCLDYCDSSTGGTGGDGTGGDTGGGTGGGGGDDPTGDLRFWITEADYTNLKMDYAFILVSLYGQNDRNWLNNNTYHGGLPWPCDGVFTGYLKYNDLPYGTYTYDWQIFYEYGHGTGNISGSGWVEVNSECQLANIFD